MARRTVGIVGTGNVGKAAAYSLFIERHASELILYDVDEQKAEGEAMELVHAQALVGGSDVRVGSYADMSEAHVVVIAAGVSRSSPEQERLDLLQQNVDIFRDIVARLDEHVPDAVLVVATNPVDVLTYMAQELSDRPTDRIVGTGTVLDTARFRSLLGAYYGVDPRHVHAYILGEHGESKVPIWSHAHIGGRPILDQEVLGKPFDQGRMMELFEEARQAPDEIIRRKGHTDLAIGVVISRIVRAILDDEKSILPVSTRLDGEYGLRDICLSLPCIVGSDGVVGRVQPKLSQDEVLGLKATVAKLRGIIGELSSGGTS